MEEQNKGFKSRLGFILAAAGSAVGLGNLWSFPYKAGSKGGAVFVLVYIAMALIIGVVAMIAEMYIGKRTGKNIIDSYRSVHKGLTWVGALGVISTTIIASYYIVLGGWVVKYAWSYLIGADVGNGVGDYAGYFNAFSQGSWEPILFMFIFFAIAMLILIFGVQNGIEKVSKVLMPVLLLLMVALTIRTLCLGDGVLEGLNFYFVPKAENVNSSTILAAMGQAFFSLSLGVGTMCVYGSYAKGHKGLAKSAFSVVILDTIVALLAGFMIFPAIFALGNGEADVTAGPGLFFIVLPRIFASMPGGRFFGFLFFFLVFVAAITSIISMVEVALQTTIEKTRIKRPAAVAIFTILIFLFGSLVSLSQGAVKGLQINGIELLTFFDTIISQYIMPVGTIIACVIVGWLINKNEIKEEFGNIKLMNVWLVLAKFITPLLVGLILFFGIFSWEGGSFHFTNDWRIILTAFMLIIVFAGANWIKIAIDNDRAKKGLLPLGAKMSNAISGTKDASVESTSEGVILEPTSEDNVDNANENEE